MILCVYNFSFRFYFSLSRIFYISVIVVIPLFFSACIQCLDRGANKKGKEGKSPDDKIQCTLTRISSSRFVRLVLLLFFIRHRCRCVYKYFAFLPELELEQQNVFMDDELHCEREMKE